MLIFIICYLLIFFLAAIIKSKKLYCFLICIILTLVAGLRHETLGSFDTQYVYLRSLKAIDAGGLDYVLTMKDIGFQMITYAFTLIFGVNEPLYLILISAPYFMAISYIIYKYSKYPMVSYIVFFSLHYFEISFTMIRQITAMAIICIAFKYIVEKKPIKFLICVICTSFIHETALIFILAYPISKLKFNKRYVFITLSFIMLILAIPNKINNILFSIVSNNERWYRYQEIGKSKNLTLFYLCAMFTLMAMIYYKKLKEDKINIILIHMSVLATIFAPMVLVLGEFSRICYFFGVFNIILFPNIIDSEPNKKLKYIIVTLSCVIFICYFLVFLGPD